MNNYLITLLSFLFINLSFAQNTWQLEKNKEGIKIWNRKSDGSILKEIKPF